MSDNDEMNADLSSKTLRVLQLANDIAIQQQKLHTIMSNGFICLAKSQLHTCSYSRSSSEDIREEVSSQSFLSTDSLEFRLQLLTDKYEALAIISAMPDKWLRKAQEQFILALRSCVDAANSSQQIQRLIDTMNTDIDKVN